MSERPGLAFKRLVLLFGAGYLTLVALTNLVDLLAGVDALDWVVLNSGNTAHVGSVTKAYGVPAWFDDLAVLGAFVVEAVGAVLFWRAVVAYRGDGQGARQAWLALIWNALVWFGFIVGTEVFVAYTAESPFRELLLLGMGMAVVLAVVPDDAGAESRSPLAAARRRR